MKRLLPALTVPVLTLCLLAGCSGDGENAASEDASPSPSTSAPAEKDQPSEPASVDPNAPGAGTEYCELLATDFASLFASIQGPEDVTDAIDVIRQIADEAPEEVRDEWGVMESALGTVQGALTKAAKLQKQAAEGEISPKKLQAQSEQLMKDMQALDTPENNKAGDAVAKHAEEYCGVKLG